MGVGDKNAPWGECLRLVYRATYPLEKLSYLRHTGASEGFELLTEFSTRMNIYTPEHTLMFGYTPGSFRRYALSHTRPPQTRLNTTGNERVNLLNTTGNERVNLVYLAALWRRGLSSEFAPWVSSIV